MIILIILYNYAFVNFTLYFHYNCYVDITSQFNPGDNVTIICLYNKYNTVYMKNIA